MLVAAYNPLAWSRETVVRVPVSTAVTCMWKASGRFPCNVFCTICLYKYHAHLAFGAARILSISSGMPQHA